MKKLTKGVKVEVVDGVVSVDIAIVIEYGHNIPQTSRNVQNKVKAAIEATGYKVLGITTGEAEEKKGFSLFHKS